MGLPLRILFVEDNEGDVALFRAALYESGVPHTIEVKADGEEAIKFVSDIDHNRHIVPDLVLLDLNLPKRHGFDVLAAIRRSTNLSKSPVIVLSSSKEAFEVRRAYDLQANAYVMKPASLQQVFALAKGISLFWSLNVNPSQRA